MRMRAVNGCAARCCCSRRAAAQAADALAVDVINASEPTLLRREGQRLSETAVGRGAALHRRGGAPGLCRHHRDRPLGAGLHSLRHVERSGVQVPEAPPDDLRDRGMVAGRAHLRELLARRTRCRCGSATASKPASICCNSGPGATAAPTRCWCSIRPTATGGRGRCRRRTCAGAPTAPRSCSARSRPTAGRSSTSATWRSSPRRAPSRSISRAAAAPRCGSTSSTMTGSCSMSRSARRSLRSGRSRRCARCSSAKAIPTWPRSACAPRTRQSWTQTPVMDFKRAQRGRAVGRAARAVAPQHQRARHGVPRLRRGSAPMIDISQRHAGPRRLSRRRLPAHPRHVLALCRRDLRARASGARPSSASPATCWRSAPSRAASSSPWRCCCAPGEHALGIDVFDWPDARRPGPLPEELRRRRPAGRQLHAPGRSTPRRSPPRICARACRAARRASSTSTATTPRNVSRNDLELAHAVLHPDGIIALDDMLHPGLPDADRHRAGLSRAPSRDARALHRRPREHHGGGEVPDLPHRPGRRATKAT